MLRSPARKYVNAVYSAFPWWHIVWLDNVGAQCFEEALHVLFLFPLLRIITSSATVAIAQAIGAQLLNFNSPRGGLAPSTQDPLTPLTLALCAHPHEGSHVDGASSHGLQEAKFAWTTMIEQAYRGEHAALGRLVHLLDQVVERPHLVVDVHSLDIMVRTAYDVLRSKAGE